MTTEQKRSMEHIACVRAQAEVTAAIEAADLIISRLKAVDQAFRGLSPACGCAGIRARMLADELGVLLDALVERDPGTPGEQWPNLTVQPAAPSPS